MFDYEAIDCCLQVDDRPTLGETIGTFASEGWTIETMFGNLKTKDFALEATHPSNPDKLCTLLTLLAFAVALTVKPTSQERVCMPFQSKNMAAALGRCSLSV